MADAKTVAGVSLLVKVSDMGGTPVFAHPCLINAARGIQFSSATNERNIPDCTNPELMAWTKINKQSLSAKINGSGVLNTPDNTVFFTWYSVDDARDIRVEFSGITLANGGGWFAGQFKCTDYGVTGDRGDEVSCDIALASHGAVTWVPAAA